MMKTCTVLPPTRFDVRSKNALDRVIISRNLKGSFSMKYSYIVFSDHIAITLMWSKDMTLIYKKFKKLIPNTQRIINDENKKLLILKIENFEKQFKELKPFFVWEFIKR